MAVNQANDSHLETAAEPRLHLVPQPPTQLSLLALWHLLSLDAPTVACVWIVFIARVAHVGIRWTLPTAMFIAVWMLYAADRLLDASPLAASTSAAELEERHHFHHQHRRIFLAVVVVAAVLLAALVHTLPEATLHLYAMLGALLTGWLLLVHARLSQAQLPKELAVGLFFAAAIYIPVVAGHFKLHISLFPGAILLAVVCSLNCLFLFAWEHPKNRFMAHWTTRWATSHMCSLSLIGLLASAAVAITVPAIGAACSLSLVALLVLNIARSHIRPLHLRALADAALLSPLLIFPFVI